MNKLVTLTLAAASAIAMSGCASSSSIKVTEINSLNHSQSAHLRAKGVANMKTLGPVFVKTEDRCSLADIAKSASAKFKNVSDLVNIRMEETEQVSGSNTTYSCKSSALAVNYQSVTPEEAKQWRAFFAENPTAEEAVKEVPAEPAAPTAIPEEQNTENTEAAEQPAAETEAAANNGFYVR